MNQSMQPAIQRLFQVSTLEAVSREQLEKFVEEYPCFGYGHYLLLRKLQAENADDFLTAARKTGLHFSNPFWLQWMLENEEPVQAEALVHREMFTRPGTPGHIVETIQIEEIIHDEEPPFVLDETDQSWPTMETPDPPAETTVLHSDPDAPASAAELLLESIEKAKALRESIEKINEDFHSQDGQPTPVEERPEEPLVVQAPAPTPVIETESAIETTPVIETAAIAETAPIFEPLHTIDYFASQGIRLTLDENPTDPLGRQLKSFTEWLRTMRRLPQKDREIVPDRVAEQTIQNFAAHSIEGKEPVTETMAEVLAKQGMPERARVVYEKLSLLNPDKSAYFAAKIEQLNTH